MATTAEVTRLVSDLDRFIARAMTIFAINLHANLVKETPVSTGWARANWQLKVGSPTTKPLGSRERPPALNTTPDIDYTDPSQGKVFVFNNVPYINELNAGSSRKAPAGFVEKAIEEALASVSGLTA